MLISQIFILDLTPDFNVSGKDNCKTRRETFKFWDLLRLILEVWRYVLRRPLFITIDVHLVQSLRGFPGPPLNIKTAFPRYGEHEDGLN